jgi:prolycopene isomerase
MQRYTLNQQGAAYGWSPTPKQIGLGRPDVKTPLTGLYQAGHWTRPGGGINGVAISGILAVQSILGITDQQQFWEIFQQIK